MEKMETVIQQLIHSYPQARLYLFGGGKDETPIMNEWAGKYPQVINASAQLSGLSQELNLMSHLDGKAGRFARHGGYSDSIP